MLSTTCLLEAVCVCVVMRRQCRLRHTQRNTHTHTHTEFSHPVQKNTENMPKVFAGASRELGTLRAAALYNVFANLLSTRDTRRAAFFCRQVVCARGATRILIQF